MKNQKKRAPYRLAFVITPEFREMLDTLKVRTGRRTSAKVLRDSLRAWQWATEVLGRGNDVVEFNPYATEGQIRGRFTLLK